VRKVKELASDAVLGDNSGGVYQAIDHLIRLGHRGIGIISGPTGLSSGAERLAGYKKALKDHRIPIEEDRIKIGDFKRESGYSLTKEIFKLSPLPTALFVANNQMTIGALQALTELKIRILEDISFVGFDDGMVFFWTASDNGRAFSYLLGKTAGRCSFNESVIRKTPKVSSISSSGNRRPELQKEGGDVFDCLWIRKGESIYQNERRGMKC
jgi:hypothetical protein